MKIYVISLKSDINKRAHVIKELGKYSIPFEFFDAIDGVKLNDFNVLSEWRDPWSHLHITKGEVGCALSHITVWDKIKNGSDNAAIILEDDFIIQNSYALKRLANWNMTPHFDFIYLGRKKISEEAEEIVPLQSTGLINMGFTPSETLVNAKHSYWTIGYIITRLCAQTLSNEWYKNNIFPVDEYIPWFFGRNNLPMISDFQFKNQTGIFLAFEPPIIKPNDSAFNVSTTFFSPPVPVYNNEVVLVTVATEYNDCVKRYVQSCRRYGIDPIILGLNEQWLGGDMSIGQGGGQKVILLRKFLRTLSKNTLIIFTDSYDVIANNHISIAIQKYKAFYNNKIVFGSEVACWPNEALSLRYPTTQCRNKYLNSGNFMGWSNDIKNIVETDIEHSFDDQLYYTQIYLDSLQISQNICLDYENRLFVCLNDAGYIDIEYNKSCLTILGQRPCFIHGNGPSCVKRQLNSISNYCVAGWNSTYGYKCLNKLPQLPKILIVYEEYPCGNTATIDSILNQWYPKDKITLVHMYYHKESDKIKAAGYASVKSINIGTNSFNDAFAMKEDAEYVLYINSITVLTHNGTLFALARERKSAIAPLLVYDDGLTSNFCKTIDSDQESNEYLDIINGIMKGCWNVPYIWYCVLMKAELFTSEYLTNLEKGTATDQWFCEKMRKNNRFMFVLNTDNYGNSFQKNTLLILERI